MKAKQNSSKLILADSHVHLHHCFDTEQVLDSAWDNFQRVATQKFAQDKFTSLLFLTELEQQNQFKQLREQLENQATVQIGNWKLSNTKDEASLLAGDSDSNKKIILIAGHQIVTIENMEVLALISTDKVRSGLSLDETVEKIASAGGIPVLPWGFGKWIAPSCFTSVSTFANSRFLNCFSKLGVKLAR